MAKSALLKSSIGKKYWMALTGLFLCLFLVGHLAGNLQLLMPNSQLQFNQYALFMTTNPAVKILSYLTYISILFHAVDGILLAIQNKKARPVGYAKSNPSANSSFASRNMAVLGTLVLVFIATHMMNFWAKMHFDENMPLVVKEVNNMGAVVKQAVGTKDSPYPLFTVDEKGVISDEILKNIKEQSQGQYDLIKKDVATIVQKKDGEVIFIGQKDLYKLTFDFFKSKNKLFGVIPNEGLFFTIFYVLSMLVLAFHLWHGFQSAFQSLGLNNPKWTPIIKFAGKAFAVIVPILFAIIPLYIHFSK
jgi:succinate dehydrogenase / fumarate reductase cytochrome b subunit